MKYVATHVGYQLVIDQNQDGTPDRVITSAPVLVADADAVIYQGIAAAAGVELLVATAPDTPAVAPDPNLGATRADIIAGYRSLVRTPDSLVTGTITRDANGAATSAPVTWPDGTPGTYTATTVSAAFPGAVDAYRITYGSPVTKTYTQPTITRDPSTGAATNVPAIVVS